MSKNIYIDNIWEKDLENSEEYHRRRQRLL